MSWTTTPNAGENPALAEIIKKRTSDVSNKFQQKRAKQVIGKERVELLTFTHRFYLHYMNPIHRWVVLALFKLSVKANLRKKPRLSDFLQFLSQFIQAFAGYSVTHVSNVPPKIDIYSMGTRIGLANFFWKRRWLLMCKIFLMGKDPDYIDSMKRLIVSNYREGLNLPEPTASAVSRDSVRQVSPLKQA